MSRFFFLLISVVILSPPSYGLQDGFAFQTGVLNYSISGAFEGQGTSPLVQMEWLRYLKKDTSVVMNFRFARDQKIQRTRYQATNIGIRSYPINLGIPIRDSKQNSIIEYIFPFSPYLEVSVGAGRYFLKNLDSLGAAELSTDFYAASLGIGLSYFLYERFSVDISVIMEQNVGAGGALIEAQSTLALLGLICYF